jgi:hypothetical protein
MNTTKPLRIATICHNNDDHRDPSHRRVRLELTKDFSGGYVWHTDDGEDCCIGACKSVYDAEIAALQAWGAPVWDLRATWHQR